MWSLLTSLTYLAVAAPLAVGVATSLATNARTVLVDAYDGDEDVADAVGRLLVVAFVLLDVGFVLLLLRGTGDAGSAADLAAALGHRIGLLLLVLGAVHLGHLVVVSRLRRRSRTRAANAAAAQRWAAANAGGYGRATFPGPHLPRYPVPPAPAVAPRTAPEHAR